jgi:hypothetical protein
MTDFSIEVLAEARAIAGRKIDPATAISEYDKLSVQANTASFEVEMGRRAIDRTAARGGDASDYATELFSEAVSYHASRDLPCIVWRPNQVQSVNDAIALKDRLSEIARRTEPPVTAKSLHRGPCDLSLAVSTPSV